MGRWWLTGTLLVVAVLGASWGLYRSEAAHRVAFRHGQERQAVVMLRESVSDVLSREGALARVIGVLRTPIEGRWPVLADIVTADEADSGSAYIQPVSQRDRAAFERRLGVRLTESPAPGILRPAANRPLHLVVVDASSKGTKPTIGLDLAGNALRAHLMQQAARTGRQTATPPVTFLGRSLHRYGVVVYDAVRDPHGRLLGWVTVSYRALPLAKVVTSHLRGVELTIRDGSKPLVSEFAHPTGRPAILSVAGRRWSVWARAAGGGNFAIAWLVLGLGLGLAAAVTLILRQTSTREQYALGMLEKRDAEEAALGAIATAVAEQSEPAEVFGLVAHEVGQLLCSRTAAVSRFEPERNRGIIVGSWASGDEDLIGSTYSLDGPTASAQVYRTGDSAGTTAYASSTDPIADLMRTMGGVAGIAAPIIVGGSPWGALGVAYSSAEIPPDARERIVRFARLVGLAIANAAAWDKLSVEASTDSLTGMPNRRAFDERVHSELVRARRYARKLSLAVIDIDHFKQINDRLGHQAGDRVLARVAELLTDTAREGELIARIGGEEFAWLMPETDRAGAFIAAERARNAVASGLFTGLGTVTVSVGVYTAEAGDTAESMLRDADQALYWAKESGRNMSFVYSDDPLAELTPRER